MHGKKEEKEAKKRERERERERERGERSSRTDDGSSRKARARCEAFVKIKTASFVLLPAASAPTAPRTPSS
jgi:hypothetical protein